MMNTEQAKKFEPFFGKWYIEEKIGGGSYGEVYKIKRRDTLDGSTYFSALKIISIPGDENELIEAKISSGSTETLQAYFDDQLQRLEREIQTMNALKGKTNIVSYEDHDIVSEKQGDITGYHIFVRMELLEDLRHVQAENPGLLRNRSEVVRVGMDICNALELCHGHQIIHRDIKPGNIMRSKDGDYKLGDFGVARSMDVNSSMTRVGTVSFMAPEVYASGHYDERADIYSLGMVLYQLLNDNRGPFLPEPSQKVTAELREQASERRLSGQPLPFPKNADPYLGAVVLQACAFDPNERFQTAAALRQALKQSLSQPEAMHDEDSVTVSRQTATTGTGQSAKENFMEQPAKQSHVNGLLIGVFSGLVVILMLLVIGLLGIRNGWFSKSEDDVMSAAQESNYEEDEESADPSGQNSDPGSDSADDADESTEKADEKVDENENSQQNDDEIFQNGKNQRDEANSQDEIADENLDWGAEKYQTSITEGVYPSTTADYSMNLDPSLYALFDSGIDEFYFSYPTNLYYACNVSTDHEKELYGTVVYNICFDATDGSQLIFKLLERNDSDSNTQMRDYIYKNEEAALQDASKIVKNADSSRGILTGVNSEGLLVYDLFNVSDKYVMQMQVIFPDYKDEQDKWQKGYVTECIYRLCGFSGSSANGCRSYEEYVDAM